jgi:DNA-binding MarR family transcriptional regulator
MVRMGEPTWGFLTNHFYVLRCIAREPTLTLREVADRIGITERAVQRIVSELETGGYLTRAREGRRNRYVIHEGRARREMDAALPLRELLGIEHAPPSESFAASDPAPSTPSTPRF